jgi:uncharacterized membrane protein YgdD (TMEM256/DUF423 family)
MKRWIATTAAIYGLLAVILAALGSHAVDFAGPDSKDLWSVSLQIHFFHAASLLGIAALAQRSVSVLFLWGSILLAAGTLIFSGSLYLRAAAIELIPPSVTPFGGMLLIAGWALLVLIFVRKSAL